LSVQTGFRPESLPCIPANALTTNYVKLFTADFPSVFLSLVPAHEQGQLLCPATHSVFHWFRRS